VESVAWVTERKDVLSGVFFMLTLWAYTAYVRRQSRFARYFAYLAVAALFALGLLSKPTLVTLPCVMLLLDYWPLRRMAAPEGTVSASATRESGLSRVAWLVIEKLPLFALSAACCAATVWAERVAEYPTRGAWWRIGNAMIAYVDYLRQFFWPADLALLYPRRPDVLPLWQVLGAAAILLGITAAAIALRRKCPYLLIGWLWYLGTLLPAVGLVPFGNEAPADRFTYLPQIGLCVALAWSTVDWCGCRPFRRWVCGVGSAMALAVLMGCAWQQTSYWRDSTTLWNRTLACTSDNYEAHTMLGSTLAMGGHTDDAIAEFRKALPIMKSKKVERIAPTYFQANVALGIAEASKGRLDEAIACYREAIAESNPFYAQAQNNLGYALLLDGEPYEALKHLEESVRVQPDFAEAHYNFGLALHSLRHFRRAIAEYQEAIRIEPSYAAAHYNLGVVLYACGRRDDAIAQWRETLRIKPDFVEARNCLAGLPDTSGQ